MLRWCIYQQILLYTLQTALSSLLNEADDWLTTKQHQILQYNANHVQYKNNEAKAAGKNLVWVGDEKQVISL